MSELFKLSFPMFFSTFLLSCSQLSAGWFSNWKSATEKSTPLGESASFNSSGKVFQRPGGCVRELRPGYNGYVGEKDILEDCFEGLFKLNAAGKVLPGVAKSWEVLDRGLKFRFFLRQDAYYSDGQRVTAHDFVSTLHRCSRDFDSSQSFRDHFESNFVTVLGIRNAREVLAKKCSVEAIGIRALDDFTLEIELEKPVRAQLVFLSFAQPAIFVPMRTEYAQAMQNLQGVDSKALLPSNGPFYIDKIAYNEKIELKKNPYYWDKSAVKIDGVHYRFIGTTSAELAAQLSKGELDYLVAKPESAAEISKIEPSCVWNSLSAHCYSYFCYGLQSSLNQDKELREIFAMMLDHDYLKKAVLDSSDATMYGILSPHYEGVKPVKPKWSNDAWASRLKKASERLREKGYSAQNPLTIRIIHCLPISKESSFANYMAGLSKHVPEVKVVAKTEKTTTLVDMLTDPKSTSFDLALLHKAHRSPRLLTIFKRVREDTSQNQHVCHCKQVQQVLPEISSQIASAGQELSASSELKQSFARLEESLASSSLACFPWCIHSQDYVLFTKLFYMEPASVKKAIYAEQSKLYKAFEKENDASCVLDEYDSIVRHLWSDSDLSAQDESCFHTRIDEIVLHEFPVIPLGTSSSCSTQSPRVKALEPRRRDPMGRFPSAEVELKGKPSK